MNNGTTMTVIEQGCGWCQTCLNDGWGSETDPYDAERCGSAVRDLFHEACEELGRSDIVWFPATSEVHGLAKCDSNDRSRCYGGVDGGEPIIDLKSLQEACFDVVWDWMEVLVEADEEPTVEVLGDLKRFIVVGA